MHGSNHTDLTSEHMTLSLVSLLVPDHRSKKPELHHSICVGAWFHLPPYSPYHEILGYASRVPGTIQTSSLEAIGGCEALQQSNLTPHKTAYLHDCLVSSIGASPSSARVFFHFSMLFLRRHSLPKGYMT